MGCCDRESNNVDAPDGIDRCCNVRGKRCMCLPYDDAFFITSQILTIVALFLSWIWWVTFLVSIVGMVLYQVPWCCRQNAGALFGSAMAAALAAAGSLTVAIYVLVAWRNRTWCNPFVFLSDDYPFDNSYYDYCQEEAWGSIAFVCAFLWAAASGCMMYFVFSGRHAKWEGKHSGSASTTAPSAIELEAVETAASPVAEAAAAVVEEPTGKVDDV